MRGCDAYIELTQSDKKLNLHFNGAVMSGVYNLLRFTKDKYLRQWQASFISYTIK